MAIAKNISKHLADQAKHYQDRATDLNEKALAAIKESGVDFGAIHPTYQMLIAPLFAEIERLCDKYDFSCVMITHTPIEGVASLSRCEATIKEDANSTILKVVELVKSCSTISELPNEA